MRVHNVKERMRYVHVRVSIVNLLCLILMLSLHSHDQITVFGAQSLLVIEIELRDNVSTLFAT